MNAKLYCTLTKQFLRFLEELTPAELASIEARAKRVEFRLLEVAQRRLSNDTDLGIVAQKLRAATTSEEAHALVEGLTKEALTNLSRVFDLPIQKSDNVERMRERIVQSTIGFKLRSQAIHRNEP